MRPRSWKLQPGQHVRGSVPADIRKRVEVVGYARDGGADDVAVEGGVDGEEDAEGWEGGGGGGCIWYWSRPFRRRRWSCLCLAWSLCLVVNGE